MARAKLFRVILPVGDIATAAAFYENLFALPGRRVSPRRHYFDCGGVILALYDPRADGDDFDATPNPDHIYFAVPDLEAIFERVKNLPCKCLEAEIKSRPWGERNFYAADPFGDPICFVDEKTIFTGPTNSAE